MNKKFKLMAFVMEHNDKTKTTRRKYVEVKSGLTFQEAKQERKENRDLMIVQVRY